MLNPDYRDMLSMLNDEGVEYLVVGAHTLAAHGYPRATGESLSKSRMGQRHARPNWNAIDKAEELMQRFSLSWWDSLLIATCLLAGVRTLYSEDYDAYPVIDGMELRNPFRSGG